MDDVKIRVGEIMFINIMFGVLIMCMAVMAVMGTIMFYREIYKKHRDGDL